jgi:hypothetical protein
MAFEMTSQHEHNPLFALELNSNKDDGALSGKRRMRPLKEGHHLNRGAKGKVGVKSYGCNKCFA